MTNTPQAPTGASSSSGATSFASLPLNPAVLSNLVTLGYLEMTPIQAASLPTALLGKDLIAQAKTGSGKTAAFALALLTRRASAPLRRPPRSAGWRVPKRM